MNIVFHIGLHKTGSSWLQQVYFRAHPDIIPICDPECPWNDTLVSYLVRTPPLRFNAGKCRAIFERQLQKQQVDSVGKVHLISAERLSGHPWSGGFDTFEIAGRIHSAFPEARIVCLLREQVSMIDTAYRQVVSEGYPGTLQDLLGTQRWKGVGFDWSFYDYDRLVEGYNDIFGAGKVTYLAYESMRSSSEEFFLAMNKVLGVGKSGKLPDSGRVNPSLSRRGVQLVRFANRFRRSELNPYPCIALPKGFHRIVLKAGKRLLLAPGKVVDEVMQAKIRNYYRESNARLLQRLGAEFESYCYEEPGR